MKALLIQAVVFLLDWLYKRCTKKEVKTYVAEAKIELDNLPTRDELISKYDRLSVSDSSADKSSSDTGKSE